MASAFRAFRSEERAGPVERVNVDQRLSNQDANNWKMAKTWSSTASDRAEPLKRCRSLGDKRNPTEHGSRQNLEEDLISVKGKHLRRKDLVLFRTSMARRAVAQVWGPSEKDRKQQ
ncbi:hypothetical protein Rs2_09091 [Raphanus sativus]|nr:hypothetical protein Rs2_09091 [Raphanus sativus]